MLSHDFHGTHLYAKETEEAFNRRTSAYTLTVETADGDYLVSRYPGLIIDGSGPDSLVFRARSDAEALDTAKHVAAGHHFTLHTGFGVHRRYL